jgi:hypothetical protein
MRQPTEMLGRGTKSLFLNLKALVGDFPEVTIQFTGLTVYLDEPMKSGEMPTMFRAIRNLIFGPCAEAQMHKRVILKELTGILRPRTMTLVRL